MNGLHFERAGNQSQAHIRFLLILPFVFISHLQLNKLTDLLKLFFIHIMVGIVVGLQRNRKNVLLKPNNNNNNTKVMLWPVFEISEYCDKLERLW